MFQDVHAVADFLTVRIAEQELNQRQVLKSHESHMTGGSLNRRSDVQLQLPSCIKTRSVSQSVCPYAQGSHFFNMLQQLM